MNAFTDFSTKTLIFLFALFLVYGCNHAEDFAPIDEPEPVDFEPDVWDLSQFDAMEVALTDAIRDLVADVGDDIRAMRSRDENLRPEELAMVLHEGHSQSTSPYLVLEPQTSPDWFGDILAYESDEFSGTYAARASVNLDEVPLELAQWMDRRVQLFDGDGASCHGQVDGLFGLIRVVPHFGTVSVWQGNHEEYGVPAESITEESISRSIWEMGHDYGHGSTLVARLSYDEDCEGLEPVWAQNLAEDTRPLRRAELTESQYDELVNTFRDSPGYQNIQDSFIEYTGQQDRDWTTFDSPGLEINAFRSDESGRIFATLSAMAGGCGTFDVAFTAIFEVIEDGAILLGELSDFVIPTAMVDITEDGIPHIISHSVAWRATDAIFRHADDSFEVAQQVDTAFFDCGC